MTNMKTKETIGLIMLAMGLIFGLILKVKLGI